MRRVLTAVALIATVFSADPAWADALEGIRIAPEVNDPPFNRDDWPHWVDEDGDEQDARQEVLIAESYVRPVIRGGKVVEGLWVGPYSGFVTRDPGPLDIDHMVPLKEAHQSGGYGWTEEKRRAYANDLSEPGHLIAVWLSTNRSKGPRDPAEWMPPNRSYWCEYLSDWVAVKRRWDLSMDQAEADAVRRGLGICDDFEKRDRLP